MWKDLTVSVLNTFILQGQKKRSEYTTMLQNHNCSDGAKAGLKLKSWHSIFNQEILPQISETIKKKEIREDTNGKTVCVHRSQECC